MAINKLTNEQLTTMSYTDVAEYVLEQKNKKMKIADLFMEVIKLRGDEESIFESKIGDFFGLVSTDKRFVMLDKGFFDLSKKYKNKVDLNIEEDEEEEIEIEEEETEEEDEINYDEAIDVDDDQEDDDYKDLVVIDSDEDVNMDL